MLIHLCGLLDDGGFASPLNVKDEDWQPIRLHLIQVNDDDNFVAYIDALHEYADEPSQTCPRKLASSSLQSGLVET